MARNQIWLNGVGLKFDKRCRLIFMTTALVTLYSLSLIYPNASNYYMNGIDFQSGRQNFKPNSMELRRPIGWLERDDQLIRRPLADNELVDLTDFAYVIEPRRPCWKADYSHGQHDQGRQIYFIVYIHSAPDHFEERQAIRSTWGSLHELDMAIRVVFMLGLDRQSTKAKMDNLQSRIKNEHLIYDDLIQGNFVDSYRNLTYKHLMGYKWVTSRCPLATLIVKADDDVFVDLIQLRKVLSEVYRTSSSSSLHIRDALACSVWPAGRSSPQRDKNAKWAVTYDEYPYDSYPAYCGGLAYVISPDVAADLLATSSRVPFFWIDDVYVTGILVDALSDGPRRQALNLRTTYDTSALIAWLRSNGGLNQRQVPCPFVFGDVSGSGRDNMGRIMRRLWQKTVDFWRNYSHDQNRSFTSIGSSRRSTRISPITNYLGLNSETNHPK